MKRNGQEDFAERVRANQQALASDLGRRFDYAICGAGTSGSVVAARLAADLNTRMLLLEAGGIDETDLIRNPNRWPMTLGSAKNSARKQRRRLAETKMAALAPEVDRWRELSLSTDIAAESAAA